MDILKTRCSFNWLRVFGGGARFGEVGVVVLDLRVGFAVGKLVGEAIVGFAGMGGVRPGSAGRGVFGSAFAGIGIGVGGLGHGK